MYGVKGVTNTPLSEEEVSQALEEFKKEEESIFPQAHESLVNILSKKQKAKEIMVCPRCSVVFDRSTTKAFEASKIRKGFEKVQESKVKGKK